MPHYSYRKTFTSGKSEDAQEELEMPCHWGILTDVTITFPDGCHEVVHVHIDDGLHQIFPTNPEANYALNGYTLPIKGEYLLLPSKRKIFLRGWNAGVYDHTISVTFRIRIEKRLTKTEELLKKIYELWERVI